MSTLNALLNSSHMDRHIILDETDRSLTSTDTTRDCTHADTISKHTVITHITPLRCAVQSVQSRGEVLTVPSPVW